MYGAAAIRFFDDVDLAYVLFLRCGTRHSDTVRAHNERSTHHCNLARPGLARFGPGLPQRKQNNSETQLSKARPQLGTEPSGSPTAGPEGSPTSGPEGRFYQRPDKHPNPFDEQGAGFGPALGPKPNTNGPHTGPQPPGPPARAVWDGFLVHSH